MGCIRPKLAIFDYSGTLSIDAIRFGTVDNLREQLHRSGLDRFGLTQPALYWHRVAKPTWDLGSTSRVGYAVLMARSLRATASLHGHPQTGANILQASQAFVRRYLKASAPAPEWMGLLKRLNRHRHIWSLIATDHYLEASAGIRGHLHRHGLTATPVASFERRLAPHLIWIANSAEIGAHKASTRFWRRLAPFFASVSFRHILLIDDFGSNEQAQGGYGDNDRVLRRRRRTVRAIRRTWPAPVKEIFFEIKTPSDSAAFQSAGRKAIRQTCRQIERWMRR